MNFGFVVFAGNINLDMSNPVISVSAKGGQVMLSNLVAYDLKSIWDERRVTINNDASFSN